MKQRKQAAVACCSDAESQESTKSNKDKVVALRETSDAVCVNRVHALRLTAHMQSQSLNYGLSQGRPRQISNPLLGPRDQ
jgi:hypothetical protein